MKVIFGVLLTVHVASAAVYIADLQRFLGDLPVTKYDLPGFVERTYSSDELDKCSDRRGQFVDDTFTGTPSNYNISEILKKLGGAPGEVEAPRKGDVAESPVQDPAVRPLEEAPEDKWLYDYRATDYKYYYRLEHAVKRFPGTEKEFLDIRGQLAWTPEDTCGQMKVASYRQDDTGFHSEVKTDYCNFRHDKYFSCATVAYCHTQPNGKMFCIG